MKLPSWEMSRAKLRRCRGLEASRVGGVSTPAPSISTSKRSMTGLTRRRPATSLAPSPRRRNNQTGPSLNNRRSYVLFTIYSPEENLTTGKRKLELLVSVTILKQTSPTIKTRENWITNNSQLKLRQRKSVRCSSNSWRGLKRRQLAWLTNYKDCCDM